MHIEFTVYGDPVSLKRHRDRKPVTKWVNGKPMTFTPKFDPSAGDKSDFLAKAIEAKPDTPLAESIRVFVRAFFSRPQGHYGKRKGEKYLKDNSPFFHTGTPDADNLMKFIGDSLNGIFWKDDKFISSASIVKLYTESTPRVTVEIWTINESPLPFETNTY